MMSQDHFHSHSLSCPSFRMWIAKHHRIWQMDFLNPNELARFSNKHGLSCFEKDDIVQLWQLGLLQADIIKSSGEIQYPGLIKQEIDEDEDYTYSDERTIPAYEGQWEEAITSLESLPPGIELLFHPFRFFVLAQLESQLLTFRRTEKVGFPIQTFGIPNFAFFQNWANSDDFRDKIQQWNDAASLAIIAEPRFYTRIFGSLSVTLPLDYEAQRHLIQDLWENAASCYQSIGTEALQEAHQEICLVTQRLDPNYIVHIILRLGTEELRCDLEGKLGGAMHLHSMAEILRRATEEALEISLPEEDERGFGDYPKDAKKHSYGSSRLLDGNRLIANEFLRQYGLVYNLRLRWYVEGDTEYGALTSYLNELEATDIEVINLHAHVAQKAGKGLTFRDSLRSDMNMHIFSFVTIDGDRNDFVSAVRRAAEQDQIFGAFFITENRKDFEFENFELSELEEVLWAIVTENSENQLNEEDHEKLHASIEDATNSTELINKAKKVLPQLALLNKGTSWGARLMAYAKVHPSKQGKKRQIMDAIEYAFYLARTPELESYQTAREYYKVDKETGKLIPR